MLAQQKLLQDCGMQVGTVSLHLDQSSAPGLLGAAHAPSHLPPVFVGDHASDLAGQDQCHHARDGAALQLARPVDG